MQATISREAVLDFLLHDANFPRSLVFCLEQMVAALKRLPRNRRLHAYLRQLTHRFSPDVDQLSSDDRLSDYLDSCQKDLGQLHELIAMTYFSLDGHRRQRQQ